MNRFLSILGGVIGGIVMISFVELINIVLYPIPSGIDVSDPKQMEVIMQLAPIGALIMIILAWFLGSFVAGAITKIISKEKKLSLSLISGAVLMAFGLAQLMSFFHPIWFWIIGLAVFLPAAYLGFKVIKVKTIAA